jgi:hypothetical protein
MGSGKKTERLEGEMHAKFKAELPYRVDRASRIELQNFIPAHWFAAAASECASMYIAGSFYGAISVAQAYVEALSLFLVETHSVRAGKDCVTRCRRLHREKVISAAVCEAAVSILSGRNDFHHLNKQMGARLSETPSARRRSDAAPARNRIGYFCLHF